MDKILDYQIQEKIDETGKSITYRAKKANDDNSYIVKILKSKSSAPTATEIARIKQEYESIQKLALEGIIKTHDVINYENSVAVILEDFSGKSLKNILRSKKLDLPTFLKIAIKISGILGELHRRNIIHQDIKPANILINENNEAVKLTDFGISKILNHGHNELYDPVIVEGTLAYLSPEQTGRMNRSVDYRSDLYSLGVTFYEILTGSVPFRSSDPMEIIYAHIARQPVPPSERDTSIPKIVSDIVMKLLSKNSEDRYQNSFGLKADLENCFEQLKAGGAIAEFELARNDISFTLNIPQRLFGREAEINVLMDAFNRAMQGSKEMVLVSGNPGIGKTALVQEIRMPVIEKKGYFISGKYERLRKEIPYSAIIQAFQVLALHILSEGEERIAYWRKNILEAVDPNGGIITGVIPEMEMIIGEQPEVPEVGTEELQNRFNLVFKKFVGVFAAQARPIVLFLDDLQWADSASFRLMKMLITPPDLNNLLLIGAYRDSEVDKSHLMALSLDEIKKEGIAISELFLQPLNLASVNQLIESTLRSHENNPVALSELVLMKTGGNPFFVKQFLNLLYEQKLITLDPASGWKWDIRAINEMRVTDNVVDLLAGKIRSLKPETQEALKIAVCAGTRFQLETLSAVSWKSIDEIQSDLAEAVHMGMICFSEGAYRFVHDRIQEAAYQLISDEEKKKLHHAIGTFVLNSTSAGDLMDKIFYIVNQLNAGVSLVTSEMERIGLTGLNLAAGEKAMSSAAYDQAFRYFSMGITLLRENCWGKHYDLSLKLHTEAAKAALLNLDFAQMEQFSGAVLSHANTLLDKIPIYELRIQRYYAQNKLLEAIDESLQVLKLLGCRFPKRPNYAHIGWRYLKIKGRLWGKKIEEFYSLDEMHDGRIQAIMSILDQVGHSLYRTKPYLTLIGVFEVLLLTLKYGISPQTSYAFAAYGFILSTIVGDIDTGYRFGQLALSLKEQPIAKKTKARSWLAAEIMIRHWKNHVREIIPSLLDIYKLGLETGDIEFATIAAHNYCLLSYFAGKPLKELGQEMAMYSNIICQFKQETNLYYNEIYRQTVLNLTGETNNPCALTGEAYQEETMVPVHISANDGSALFDVYLLKTFLNYLFQQYTKAVEYADKTKFYLNNVRGLFIVPLYYFYDSLARLAVVDQTAWSQRMRHFRRIRANQKKMKKWAHHAPTNHLHRYLLVEAEITRLKGDHLQAGTLYEKAIQAAHENGFIQDEAVACERAAYYYIALGNENIASVYIAKAQLNYQRWGAAAKVRSLRESYSQFYNPSGKMQAMFPHDPETVSTGSGSEMLDLSSIIQVSQTLASEIVLGNLLEKIIKIAVENAGAQKGFFILKNEESNRLYIEAEYSTDAQLKVLQSTPIEESSMLSMAIINYVNMTGENLVLDHACRMGLFVNDPYISLSGVKSVLCMPVTDKGKMVGILYLENNLTTGAFTADRLKLLQIVSAQAAISIENSRLIAHREKMTKLQTEMKIAANIQAVLLPERPSIEGFEITAYLKPTEEVGGDYYDVIDTGNNNWVIIGDVSGHGVPAGLIMMMVLTVIQALVRKFPDIKPSDLLSIVNEALKYNVEKIKELKYMTITAFSFQKDGHAVYSGRHQDFLVYRAASSSVDIIPSKGTWLMPWDMGRRNIDSELHLNQGDTMLLYTDGISEAMNTEKLMFSEEKLAAILKQYGTHKTDEIKDKILEELQGYTIRDDMTMVILKKK